MQNSCKNKIFISSVYHGLEDIRCKLYFWAKHAGYEAWLFEKVRLISEWENEERPTIQTIFIEEVKTSDLYIGIFSHRYGGSGEQHYSKISYTDLEFFEAFRQNKPIKCYILEPFNPETELKMLLEIIRVLVPGSLTTCKTEQTLLETIKKDIDIFFSKKTISNFRNITDFIRFSKFSRFSKFINSCILDRQQYDDQEGGLRLLIPQPRNLTLPLDKNQLEQEISLIKNIKHYQEQLNSAMAVISKLSMFPWNRVEHSEYLKLWDAVLSIWDKASAWYGLHGFTYLGKLAANNTSIAIRSLIASRGESENVKKLLFSHPNKTGCIEEWVNLYSLGGNLASEYYSIAQTVFSKKLKKKYLLKAKNWVNVAERTYEMEQDWYKQASISSIKGQIFLRLGNIAEAIKILERSLCVRQDYKLGENYVAVAKSNLGYAYMKQQGMKAKAEKFLLEGLEISEKLMDTGFCVRAKLKLAEFLFCQREFKKALQQVGEAEAICKKYGIESRLDKYSFLLHIPIRIISKFWVDIDSIEVIETREGFRYTTLNK